MASQQQLQVPRAPTRRPSLNFAALSNLNNYVEGEMIGQGSFGVIHKVTRKSDGVVFAQKQLNFSRMSQKDKQQLVSEVNILNKLTHPNIVGFTERILDGERGIIYIIMEYCGGGDLSQLIRESERTNRPIPEDTIWDYFSQIVSALLCCHEPGDREAMLDSEGRERVSGRKSGKPEKERERVLHRDLKPDNIFLDSKHEFVKLGDFGLSKAMGASAFANTYVGTPYYMSPELFNENAYDAKSDIWALGCVIYELVALHPPFHSCKTHNDLAQQLRSQRIPPLPRSVSPALKEVIFAMLNFNPANRPSAKELSNHKQVVIHRRNYQMLRTRTLLQERSAQVLQREELASQRETAIRSAQEALKAREEVLLVKEQRFQSEMAAQQKSFQKEVEMFKIEREKFEEERRSGMESRLSAASSQEGSPGGDMDGIEQTSRNSASRVPRRSFGKPLEERSASISNIIPNRGPSSRDSCVFDLSTPTRANNFLMAVDKPPTSLRRTAGTPSRLASKSMGNLAATARGHAQMGMDEWRRDQNGAPMNQSPISSRFNHESLLQASNNANANASSRFGSTTTGIQAGPRRTSTVPVSGGPPARPPLPASLHSLPVTLPSAISSSSIPQLIAPEKFYPDSPAKYDPNDLENLPSPFLRKTERLDIRPQSAMGSLSVGRTMVRSKSSQAGENLARRAMANNGSQLQAGSVSRGEQRPPTLTRQSRQSVARADLAANDAQRALAGHV